MRELKEHFLMQKIEKAIPGQLDKVFIVQGDSQEIGEKSYIYRINQMQSCNLKKELMRS